MKTLLEQIDKSRLPRHVAIIMDGNGRWARRQGNERSQGHVAGVGSVKEIIETASKLGVKYLTLYAFSTENWNRPKDEVDMLLALIVSVLAEETEGLRRNNVKLQMIGDRDRMPREAQASLDESMAATSGSTGMVVNLALSYSSRWELTEAARTIARKAAAGEIDVESIDEQTIDLHLSTAGTPDPDLLIRTGGDERVSNFLLWQIAYSELYFTDTYWPDFGAEDFYKAIVDYQSRERRFGMTSDQVNNNQ